MELVTANREMVAAWDGDEGEHWADHAARYEAVGLDFWPHLAGAISIQPEDRVLDVGCGTGHTSLEAARIAGSGEVLGVDLSSRMLAHARQAASAGGLTNVTFEQADAQVHPFPAGAFDVVMSAFGAMFFDDPAAAFANIGRAMVPGARLGLLAWRPLAENQWLTAIRMALAAGRELPAPPPGAPGPFGLADEGMARAHLAAGGFVDIDITPVDGAVRLGDDPDDAFGFVSQVGLARALVQDLDEATKGVALERLRGVLADHHGPQGVTLGGAAWLLSARAGS
jgi:SAM-dependent methyltransferase